MRVSIAALLVGAVGAFVPVPVVGQSVKKDETVKSPAVDVHKVEGKTYEEWAKDFTNKDPGRRETAFRMAASFPPETNVRAVPEMIKELKRHSGSTHVDISVRASLCVALQYVFLTSGGRVAPDLRKQAILQIIRQLSDPQIVMKYRAAQALMAFGGDPTVLAAIAPLRGMLREQQSSYEVRQVAAQTLGYIAYDSKGPSLDVLKDLYSLLHNDPSHQVRVAAVQSLYNLGPPADTSQHLAYFDNLKAVTKDPDPTLQLWAYLTLANALSDYSRETLAPITKLTHHPEAFVRTQTLQAMGSMGLKVKSEVAAIAACLKDPDPGVVIMATWALSQLGPAALPWIDELEKLAADTKKIEQVRNAAKKAVERIKGK